MFFSSGPCKEWNVYRSLSDVGHVMGLRLWARSAWWSASARTWYISKDKNLVNTCHSHIQLGVNLWVGAASWPRATAECQQYSI